MGQRDAGAIAAKKMRQKDQEKVNFLPVEEGSSYGITRGSGKPSGPMAAFAKKEKEKKKEIIQFARNPKPVNVNPPSPSGGMQPQGKMGQGSPEAIPKVKYSPYFDEYTVTSQF